MRYSYCSKLIGKLRRETEFQQWRCRNSAKKAGERIRIPKFSQKAGERRENNQKVGEMRENNQKAGERRENNKKAYTISPQYFHNKSHIISPQYFHNKSHIISYY